MLPTQDSLSFKDTYVLKVTDWKKIVHASRNQKKAEIAILRHNSLQAKNSSKRSIYNYKWVNPSGRYNNCEYICTQHCST